MAITLDGTASGNNDSGSGTSVSATLTCSNNDNIIVALIANNTSGTSSTPSRDFVVTSSNLTWHYRRSYHCYMWNYTMYVEEWYAYTGGSLTLSSEVITASYSSDNGQTHLRVWGMHGGDVGYSWDETVGAYQLGLRKSGDGKIPSWITATTNTFQFSAGIESGGTYSGGTWARLINLGSIFWHADLSYDIVSSSGEKGPITDTTCYGVATSGYVGNGEGSSPSGIKLGCSAIKNGYGTGAAGHLKIPGDGLKHVIVLLWCANKNTSEIPSSVTCDQSLATGFTLIGNDYGTSVGDHNMGAYYAVTNTVSSDTVFRIYWDTGSMTYGRTLMFEVTGANTSSPLDPNGTLPGFAYNTGDVDASPQTASFSTTNADDLIIAWCFHQYGAGSKIETADAGHPFMRFEYSNAVPDVTVMAWMPGAAQSSKTINWSESIGTTSSDWYHTMVFALRASGGGGNFMNQAAMIG